MPTYLVQPRSLQGFTTESENAQSAVVKFLNESVPNPKIFYLVCNSVICIDPDFSLEFSAVYSFTYFGIEISVMEYRKDA